ncbi:nuclease-related domain-containing DEAD/DEAH box helicase [Lapillicoccus jejuensis]|nr:NERD domain-containing protein [Lapillicoccus jejuensis]
MTGDRVVDEVVEPAFRTESERLVWQELRRQLPVDAVVLPNLRLTDEELDHEIDFFVMIPGAGLVAVEVKGGDVRIDADGRWRQGRRAKVIDPVGQVRRGKYALRDYVEQDPRWRDSSRRHVRWVHAVVLPFSRLPADFAHPECPRWAVSDRDDLPRLAERLADSARRQETGRRAPDEDDVALVREILTGRGVLEPDPGAEADERQARADRLTREQAMLLHVTRLLRRVEVRGGAGSGKTVLALTQAKELTRGQGERRPQRVALLCYSIGLAAYLRREVAAVPRRHRPAFVGCFEDLARELGIHEFAARDDTDFWEQRLAPRMTELAQALPDGRKFDAVIVDEAQDFADDWWRPLMSALRDPDEGGVYAYSDENQRIFARFGRPPVELVPLVLDHNLRNTQQIATVFQPLAPMRMSLRGGDGPDVRFVACRPDEAMDLANDEVEALLDEGWPAKDVALLAVGSRHQEQKERQDRRGHQGYWDSFWDEDDVFYGHVLGCKGLERRAVVLCVNADDTLERATEKLYVGLSRATDRLVVVGDPRVLRAVGGDAVARHLGLAAGA